MSKVNSSYGHSGTVSSPNHTFSWASLNNQNMNWAWIELATLGSAVRLHLLPDMLPTVLPGPVNIEYKASYKWLYIHSTANLYKQNIPGQSC